MKAYLRKWKIESLYVRQADGWNEEPYEFLTWGILSGDTYGILKNEITGEVCMRPPGDIRFETGPEPVTTGKK